MDKSNIFLNIHYCLIYKYKINILDKGDVFMDDNKDIQIFNNKEFGTIRVTMINGEPYFVGKDVASTLGYSDTSDALKKHVDDEDKMSRQIADSLGRMQNTKIINESGLYSLILSSKLPTAKKFKRWITADVLPSIRKHGAYMTEETIEKALLNPDFLISLATELKKEKEQRIKLEKENVVLEKEKEILKQKEQENIPKVKFYESVAETETLIYVRDLAKLITQNGVKIGEKRLFQWLRENGYLIRKKGSSYNTPTQKSVEMGLFKLIEASATTFTGRKITYRYARVTGKGQIYFVNKFLKEAQ